MEENIVKIANCLITFELLLTTFEDINFIARLFHLKKNLWLVLQSEIIKLFGNTLEKLASCLITFETL